jgi:hypothetical protein
LFALSTVLAAPVCAAPAPTQPHLQSSYGKLPLQFEANAGQTDKQVKFLSRGNGYSLFLTPTQAVLSLRQAGKKPKASILRMQIVGANAGAKVTGQGMLPGTVNYFRGNDPSTRAWTWSITATRSS